MLFRSVNGLKFSPDGLHLAYVAERDGKELVVVDSTEGPAYHEIMPGTPIFSPDSRRVAYAADAAEGFVAVADGRAGKAYEGIIQGTLTFSPDGAHVAYGARRGDAYFVVVDGAEGDDYDGFVKDSELGWDSPTELHALVTRYGADLLMVNGKWLSKDEKMAWSNEIVRAEISLEPGAPAPKKH